MHKQRDDERSYLLADETSTVILALPVIPLGLPWLQSAYEGAKVVPALPLVHLVPLAPFSHY